MTIAMILTTAISLGLLGGGLIIARMTDQMRDIYGDKVEVTVYLTAATSPRSDPDCPMPSAGPRHRRCPADAEYGRLHHRFESQAAAWSGTSSSSPTSPRLLDIASEAALSASFHVKLNDPQHYREVIARVVRRKPGVQSVTDQSAFLDRLFSVLNGVRNATIIVALVQAFAALLADLEHGPDRGVHQPHRDVDHATGRSIPMAHPDCRSCVEAVVAGSDRRRAGHRRTGGREVRLHRQDARAGDPVRDPAAGRRAALVWVSPWLAGIAIALAALSAYVTLRLYVRL